MTHAVPTGKQIDRVFFITVDCLRWDFAERYVDVYPPGVWYRHTPQATYTPTSHSSAFTGLNPMRHGVYRFGDTLRKDNILTNTHNSISHSSITRKKDFVPTPGHEKKPRKFPFFNDVAPNAETWQLQLDEMGNDDLDALDEYDFIFLHDWSVHASDPAHKNSEWTTTISTDQSVAENREAYRTHVKFSTEIHKKFIEYLKDEDLYETSLFVFFGDHGQMFGGEDSGAVGHNTSPFESVARTPLAFLSPQFDATNIDVTTNARAVDVVPTLLTLFDEHGIGYDAFDHDVEGVDLTSFDGELAGYTMSIATIDTGIQDGVRTWDRAYINSGQHVMYDTSVDDDPFEYHSELMDDSLRRESFVDYYKGVRSGPDKLVVRHTPDEEHMRNMGYL